MSYAQVDVYGGSTFEGVGNTIGLTRKVRNMMFTDQTAEWIHIYYNSMLISLQSSGLAGTRSSQIGFGSIGNLVSIIKRWILMSSSSPPVMCENSLWSRSAPFYRVHVHVRIISGRESGSV